MVSGELAEYQLSVFEMVSRSGWMAKSVLLTLLIFSIISWSIILSKFFVFKIARQEDGRFLSIFSKAESLANIYNFSRGLKYSPVARVFLTGYHELYLFQELSRSEAERRSETTAQMVTSISESDLKGVSIALNKATNREIDRLASRLDFLATTGSATPFIGLFGTIWGIMHSFRMIGAQGSTSIGGVAPGIAEALIATAAGLAAAIPAVIFYNYLSNKIRLFTTKMDDFSHDFIFMAEKNFMK